jgi:hypothetical protein
MKELLDVAALVLGLAISLHTIYGIGDGYVTRLRERRALLAEVRLRFDMLLRLIPILQGRAKTFDERYLTRPEQGPDSLSDQARADLAVVEARARQVLSLDPELDLPAWGKNLTRRQLGALVAFLKDYRFYRDRLELRLQEYKAAPSRPGNLARFLGVAALEDRDLLGRFTAFERSIGQGARPEPDAAPTPEPAA